MHSPSIAIALPKRNQTLDSARGLVMLYVVAVIHGIFWLGLLPSHIGGWLLFEMPIIFIISGYAFRLSQNPTAASRPLSWRSYARHTTNRLSRILIPYYAYAVVCVVAIALDGMNQSRAPQATGALMMDWFNPLTHGKQHPLGMLQMHLWFIPPFLVVTAILPLVTRYAQALWASPAWMSTALVGVLCLIENAQIPLGDSFRSVLFYLFWAMAGYHYPSFASMSLAKRAAMFVSCAALLIGAWHQQPGPLNMQWHKFPPDWVFAAFCIAWMILIQAMQPVFAVVLPALQRRILKPFIAYGYSIYLWQGAGYTVAQAIENRTQMPTTMTWALAILLAVLMGRIASPLERIRLLR